MEYILVIGASSKPADSSALNDAVKKKIADGFEPHGSPGLTFAPQGTAVFFQAMIKK